MKKEKKLLAVLLSAALCATSVSTAWARPASGKMETRNVREVSVSQDLGADWKIPVDEEPEVVLKKTSASSKKGGWKIIKGKKYYINADGTKRRGLTTIGGKLYYLSPYVNYGLKEVRGRIYYFDKKTGAARKGWVTSKNGWKRYMKSDYTMAKSEWIRYKGRRYYLRKSGHLITGPRWITLKGKRYYITRSGGCLAGGVRTTSDGRRYFYSDGSLVTEKTNYNINGNYYNIDENGKITPISALTAECSRATQEFISRHTNSGMSDSQKFRACFNYIIAYTNFLPWKGPTAAQLQTNDWPKIMALDMLNTGISGSCYGIASLIASCAKELGYDPYVVAAAEDHCFVIIDGLYYDNMGPLFGAASHRPYTVAYKVRF